MTYHWILPKLDNTFVTIGTGMPILSEHRISPLFLVMCVDQWFTLMSFFIMAIESSVVFRSTVSTYTFGIDKRFL